MEEMTNSLMMTMIDQIEVYKGIFDQIKWSAILLEMGNINYVTPQAAPDQIKHVIVPRVSRT